MILVNLFHRVAVLWLSVSRPMVSCSSLVLCGRAVIGSLTYSVVRFALATGLSQFLRRTLLWLKPTLCLCLLDHPLARFRDSPCPFFLGVVISEAGSVQDDAVPPLRSHGGRGVSTFVAFLRN